MQIIHILNPIFYTIFPETPRKSMEDMIDALQYFKNKSIDQIKSNAVEIATQGTQGFRPEKQNYRVSQIPGKVISGYHILAYYYLSWTIAMPDALGMLRLDFGKEYEIAKGMVK